MKVRVGDKVRILAGKDKGKEGCVQRAEIQGAQQKGCRIVCTAFRERGFEQQVKKHHAKAESRHVIKGGRGKIFPCGKATDTAQRDSHRYGDQRGK